MRMLLSLLFLVGGMASYAQNITRVEYFVDEDPGWGSAKAVANYSAANNVTFLMAVGDSLNSGFHNIGLRSKDANGQWSHTNFTPVWVMEDTVVYALQDVEFFVDVDPGMGAGTGISNISAGLDLSIMQWLGDTLDPGFHNIGVRSRDVNKVWSHTNFARVYVLPDTSIAPIQYIEYYIDVDPGLGLATAMSGFTASNNVVHLQSLTDSLEPGFHNIGVRSRDGHQNWSHTNHTRVYVVDTPITNPIEKIEYFWVSDPGFDHVSAPDTILANPVVDLTNGMIAVEAPATLPVGYHALFMRSFDRFGSWSHTQLVDDSLYVCVRDWTTLNDTACLSYTAPSGRHTWTNSGTYTDTLLNSDGCDSVLTIHLSVISPRIDSTLSGRRCDSGTVDLSAYTGNGVVQWHDSIVGGNLLDTGALFTTPIIGLHTVYYVDVMINGCVSHNRLPVLASVYPTPMITVTNPGSICDSGQVVLSAASNHGTIAWFDTATGGQVLVNGSQFTTPRLDSSSVYYVEVSDSGCVSGRSVIQATVNYSTTAQLAETTCDTFVSPSGNYTYTASGTYQDTISNAKGCDSLITIALTVFDVDTSVVQNGSSLTSNADPATYQWIDCERGHTPIAGATGPNFKPSENGKYAVVVTQNGCSDTSACFTVSTVGILTLDPSKGLVIYPNPSSGQFTIDLGSSDYSQLLITNAMGQLVFNKVIGVERVIDVDLREPDGLYFVQFSNPDDQVIEVIKIIVGSPNRQ